MADLDFDSPKGATSGFQGLDIGTSLQRVQKVSTPEEFEALPFGSEYLDPEGKSRKKQWRVKDDASYEAVPEGETYLDPQGQQRTKPKYEPVGMTTQTLYYMALTDKERKKALERGYKEEGGEVKQLQNGEFYVQMPDGRLLKPGKGDFSRRAATYAASEAAPVLGSIAGEVGGGFVGSVVPGPGTLAGAIVGGGAGGAAGQAFNDMILSLAGVYDRSNLEEAENLGLAGAFGSVGTGIGRGVAAVAPAIKGAVQEVKGGASRLMAKYVGADADKEATERAARLASEGVRVPPSAWMKEAPYLKKTVEEFDPVFRQQNVLEKSAQGHYEAKGGEILETLGVPREGREALTGATSLPSSKGAGEAILGKARARMAEEDTKLAQALEDVRKTALGNVEGANAERVAAHNEALRKLNLNLAVNRKIAQQSIDLGFDSIGRDVDSAIQAAKVGDNPGDLFRAASEKIRELRKAVRVRAKGYYDAADAAAGDARPDLGDLPAQAKAMLDELPQPFKENYPHIVKQLEKLKPGEVTFGQLRNLRSVLRQDIDRSDLTPSIKDGIYRLFSGRIDDVIQASEKNPALKDAVKLLNEADAFYAREMPRFQDEAVKGIVKTLKAGLPADPEAVAKLVLQPGRTERIREVRNIVGENLWSAVTAADTRSMLNASKTLVPGEIDGSAFARQVLERVQNGTFDVAYSKEASAKLLSQAQRIMASEGKIPLQAMSGDTVFSALHRVDEYTKAINELADKDPIGLLKREMKAAESNLKAEEKALRGKRMNDPLDRFLSQPNVGAVQAAERILRSPDLLMATAARFGEDSAEFNMLRQVYAHRMLQRSTQDTSKLASEFAEKISPEVQQLMFPGVSLDAAKTLAKDMEFLLAGKTDTGGSIAAMHRVLHPWGSIGRYTISNLPGADAAGRYFLGTYYKLLSWGTTHPTFVQWVAKGLESGDPTRREASKAAVQAAMARGGMAGAGGGELLYDQLSSTAFKGDGAEPGTEQAAPPKPKRKSWREESKR